ncbi:hypothetical protein Sste5346_001163 [Sporothrix stenoceras]|uniref:Ino eighty subunit 1 n=1 Tax=Sporothrix stenoceras TaxID=5173 RepID=A0ABR3ZQM8_9PEZI
MASPSSAVSTTEVEPRTSPARDERSFANNNLTEDEASDRDDGTPRNVSRNTSRMVGTPDVQERRGGAGGGRGGRGRGGRDSSAAGGPGGPGMFKDPSAIGKIRHLKKEDGEPLWRFDIQYDFLRAIFDDDHRVFTNSYEPDTMPKQCFADLYIDTMARSSKTSKILHDKLLTDREAAKNMAMVCLLVNIGRMNTTLNFFPEMRAQLRTYHAIPSLQANEKLLDYKQLQDAPRLKSILKGGTEDRAEPRSLDILKETDVPRTNPVNLLFLICNNASKVAELHFPPGREFHDLIMKTNLTSESRARAFLWIVWFYLESDFTEEGCEENPFGAGVDYGIDVANQGVPVMVEMTPEEEAQENIDTPVERAFGLSKKSLRAKILHDEQFVEMPPHKRSSRPSRPSAAATAAAAAKEAAAVKEAAAELAGGGGTDNERSVPPAILPRIRPSKHESDLESMRSTPPPRSLIRSFGGGGGAGGATGSARRGGPHKFSLGDGGGPSPVRQPPLIQQLHQQQQMQQTRRKRKQVKPEGGRGSRHRREEDDDDEDDDRANTSVAPSRKPRPPTAHQIAVENNRKQRIEYLLSRGMHRKHHRSRKTRRTEGAIVRALRRLEEVEDPFENSEDESNLSFNRDLFTFMLGAPQSMATGNEFRERGFHGLVQLKSEPEDFGEEVSTYASAMRRACRRLNRWETDGMPKNMVVPTIKRPRVNVPPVEDEYRDPNETEDEQDADTQGMDADASISMSFVETTPAAKKRRTVGATGQVPAVAALSRGGRGGRTSTGRIPSNTPAAISARRRRAAKAAAALAAANGDVTMSDAGTRHGSAAPGAGDDGAGDEDATALASGAEGEGDAEGGEGGDDAGDDTEDVASVSATPPVNKTRVTIKKKTPGPSGLSASTSSRPRASGGRSSKVKREDDDDDETVNNDDDDELNDVDKALLGMGSDSE